MTQAKLTSGDLNGYGGFLGGNDGTMVLEVGPAGAKVTALSIDAAGQVNLPANSTNKLVAAGGTAPVFGIRAWCTFNGTTAGTNAPLASGNVTSVTRNSAGNYTINFAVAMPDANYTININGQVVSATTLFDYLASSKTTTSCIIRSTNSAGTNEDPVNVSVTIVR